MKYRLECNAIQKANVEAAVKIVDPAAVFVDSDPEFTIRINPGESLLMTSVEIPELPDGTWEYWDDEIQDPRYHPADCLRRRQERIRLGIIKLLGDFFQYRPPWGILRGVRPTKIFHNLRDKGFAIPEIEAKLDQVYGLTPANIRLVAEIGQRQERFFKPARYVSIYIGIPFCPTRCYYCSFAAVSLETHRHLVPGFLTALKSEIEALGQLVREMGFQVDTLYMGGGTPTSLDESSFAAVLGWIRQAFPESSGQEFTVEAGRPETINSAKLNAMAACRVTRISINPQSMQSETLYKIGRKHSIAAIYEAIRLAREYPSLNINMDLILGLPGERPTDFADSLHQVIGFEPENITIHALAPKKASSWRSRFDILPLSHDNDLHESAVSARRHLAEWGYQPYYLYRQRAIVADLENIGFAKPGTESIYNIQMMEERQTILSVGSGAVTKWVVEPEHRVSRLQNPKCPATYAGEIETIIVKKDQETRLLLG